MKLFLFKKVDTNETFSCARCKKEVPESELKRIGNHRFCKKCARPYLGQSVVPNNTFSEKKEVTTEPIPIKEYRNVYGYGMGRERVLTVLYSSNQLGYFFIQQTDSNAGTYYRRMSLPNGISDYENYMNEHEDEFSDWIAGWYSDKFKADMTI